MSEVERGIEAFGEMGRGEQGLVGHRVRILDCNLEARGSY